MVIPGHISKGGVVIEGDAVLPEGAAVAVVYPSQISGLEAGGQTHISFPLVRSAVPGSVDLTNDRIAEILDEDPARVSCQVT